MTTYLKWKAIKHFVQKYAYILVNLFTVFISNFAHLLKFILTGEVFVPLIARLKNISKFNKHLATNMLIGLIITLGLHFFHHGSILSESEETAMDWMINKFKGVQPNDKAIPFIWIDIDDKSYQKWKEPLFTPRDKLTSLIKLAAESGAHAVLVDVEFRHSGKTKEEKQADTKLKNYLENYPQNCQEVQSNLIKKRTCPPILLARTFRSIELELQALDRTSFLDKAVKNSPLLLWASVEYERDKDWMIRHWKLWREACTQQGKGVIFPSFQLLTVAILQKRPIKQTQEILYQHLKQFIPKNCLSSKEHSNEKMRNNKKFSWGDLELTFSTEQIARRILYQIPWPKENSDVEIPSTKTDLLLQTISASSISNLTKLEDPTLIENRIVIIGASYAESGDIHRTPLGNMPGSLIIVNSIHSLLQFGEIEPIGLYWKLLLEAILILMMSYLFAKWNSFFGMLFSGLGVIAILLPISFYLFRTGVWIDFAIPLMAVQLHELASELEDLYKSKNT